MKIEYSPLGAVAAMGTGEGRARGAEQEQRGSLRAEHACAWSILCVCVSHVEVSWLYRSMPPYCQPDVTTYSALDPPPAI